MDKKYLNSALIVLLIVIWGGIIYKYFGKSKTIEQQEAFINTNTASLNYTVAKDTFILKLNGRDPFKTSKIRSVVSNKPSKKVKKKAVAVKTLVWPKIQYFGFVKSETNKTKLALIKVNGRLHKKRERDKINELTIMKAYSDSIIVSFNKNLKTIKRL